MKKVKLESKCTGTLSFQYKKDVRDKTQKNLDILKLMPETEVTAELSDAEFAFLKPKFDFYKKHKKLSFEVVSESEESEKNSVETENTDVSLTAETFSDSDDKDALDSFAKSIGLEIDKRKSLDNIKAEITDALLGD